MMRREADWLAALLERYSRDELSPMLSVGSGSKRFRAENQPWIDATVYDPLTRRGVDVLHHELVPADGVDVVGDLGDEEVRERLRRLGVRSILCLNVFEHVRDRDGLARALVAALPVGGLLVVTVPRRFPYHADPIDTLFRPAPDELAALFADVDAATVDVVDSGTIATESLASHWLSKPGKLRAVRKALGRGDRADTAAAASDAAPGSPYTRGDLLRMGLRSTEVTYLVARRAAR